MQTFALFDAAGAPILGATPTFLRYVDGSGVSRTVPSIVSLGSGLYSFSPSGNDEYIGGGYLIDGGATAEPRYFSGGFGLVQAFAFYRDEAPLAGLSPTFTLYRDADGNARTPPTIVDLGGGLYGFTPTQADRDAFATYHLTPGATAEPTYYSGAVPEGEAQPVIPDIPHMNAKSRHITIEQGATWSHTFAAVDADGDALDLTGYTPRMEIRTAPGGALIATPTVAVTDAPGGIVAAMLTAAETELLSFDNGAYDLEVESSGTVLRLFAGRVRISPEVTTL